MEASMAEHDGALEAARAHIDGKEGPPLSPLPPGFGATREAMHRIAEDVLKPKRELETGNEIALRFTPGGFGTPPWEVGEASGRPGSIRVEGVEVVTSEGDEEDRRPLTDVDPAGAAALVDWFAFGTVVLGKLLEQHPDRDPAPIRLWPEHFDVATELGSKAAGERANYGASPGDGDHAEPYLYVGPWNQTIAGELWNSAAFVGAELGHAALLGADDQVAAAVRFMSERLLG
jgi:hypothetical protein